MSSPFGGDLSVEQNGKGFKMEIHNVGWNEQPLTLKVAVKAILTVEINKTVCVALSVRSNVYYH
ncbi:hypothetical protein J1N35_011037 [Gossypium stocksii]|uniref:Uncharacterized protein n=1 Tax=Gossypium stocksii TaxID=47602 RepID=A0A9D3W1R6_9ROSI|nr:hypothetical protein J1N35_011037 [Gossypium stocksii]